MRGSLRLRRTHCGAAYSSLGDLFDLAPLAARLQKKFIGPYLFIWLVRLYGKHLLLENV
jgi:hypothetical protein